MEDPELQFQGYAWDPKIRGGSPDVDSAPVVQKARKAHLSPQAYNNLTTDKSLNWEFEQAFEGLGKILEDE